MKLCIIFKSLLYYLLLCYGKKLAYAAEEGGTTPDQDQGPMLYSIEVDISVKESTSELIYNVELDETETFLCRKGYVIRGVYKGEKTIWEYKDGDYPNRVYIIKDADGKRTVNVRYPYDEQVVEVDIGHKYSTDYVLYFDDYYGTELYICRTGYLLSKVVKGNTVIWEFKEGESTDYPNRVVIELDENGKKQATVRFPGDEVVLLTIDVAVRQSTQYCDYVKDEEGLDAFIPKPGYVIHRVEKNGRFLWECIDDVYPERIAIYFDDKGKAKAKFKFPGEPKAPAAPPPKPKEECPIDLNIKENTMFYTYLSERNVGTYKAEKDYAFNVIKRKEELIWTTTDINKLVVVVTRDGIKKCKSMHNVTLEHNDGTVTHLAKSKKKWIEISNKTILNIAHKNTVHVDYNEEYDLGIFTPKHNCVFTVVQLSRTCGCGRRAGDYPFWHGVEEEFTRRVVTNYHFNMDRNKYVSVFLEDGSIKHFKSPTGKRGWDKLSNRIPLDIKKQDNTYEYYYAAYDQLPTYVGNYDFVFTQVVNGQEFIWRGQKDEYAKSVFTDRTDNKPQPDNIAIILDNEEKILLTKSGGSWQKSKSFPGFELDIVEHYSTTTISYAQNTDGTAHSFTARHGFLINSLKDYCKPLWQTSNKDEYAKKVIINGDNLIVKFINGQRIEFKREADQKWVQLETKKKRKLK